MKKQPQDLAVLLPMLKNLERQQQLFVIQFLVSELAQQEGGTLAANLHYPVWSPFAAYDASEILLRLLNEPDSKATDD